MGTCEQHKDKAKVQKEKKGTHIQVCVNHMHAQSMATGFKWTVATSTGMDLFALVMT